MTEKPPLPPEEQNAGLVNALKFVSKAARLTNPVTTALQVMEPKTVADATLDANPLSVYDKQVYHRTPHAEQLIKSGDIKFISKEPGSDIGFHVASEPRRFSISDEDKSNLLFKLKKDINPARVIDLESFQNPSHWKQIRMSEREDPEKFKRLEKHLLSEKAKDEGHSPPVIFEYKKDRIMINPDLVRDGLERDGKLDITYLKDLIKLVAEYDKKLNTKVNIRDRPRDKSELSTQYKREWFEALKKINKKYGYDSFSYKNEHEEQGGDSLY